MIFSDSVSVFSNHGKSLPVFAMLIGDLHHNSCNSPKQDRFSCIESLLIQQFSEGSICFLGAELSGAANWIYHDIFRRLSFIPASFHSVFLVISIIFNFVKSRIQLWNLFLYRIFQFRCKSMKAGPSEVYGMNPDEGLRSTSQMWKGFLRDWRKQQLNLKYGKSIVRSFQAKIFYFFDFDTCYRPIFILSIMGSYFTILSLLLILWPFKWRGYCEI